MPFTFTQRWIPELIENLQKTVLHNPQYKFLFDAQTLVIDDLGEVDKNKFKVAKKLIRSKNLEIGPYYAQIDQRLSSGESLIRNLTIGISAVRKLRGSENFTAWCVDLFGHVSQSPQIHKLFDISDGYFWRGIPELTPFFHWKGPDGSQIFVIDLFAGGYRNFYKVTTIEDMALKRLQHEIKKLTPYYKHGHIPVFDGYDLDKEPGDAVIFFGKKHKEFLESNNIEMRQSSPFKFSNTIKALGKFHPTLTGEFISGKYASVFPGTLSNRTYSKILAFDKEQLLYRYAEPLDVMAQLFSNSRSNQNAFEIQTKQLLQNLVHDVICGCSIDQVHEASEVRSKKVISYLKRNISKSVSKLSVNLESGVYIFNPLTTDTKTSIVDVKNNKLYRVNAPGLGIFKVSAAKIMKASVKEVRSFKFTNSYYSITLHQNGHIEDTNKNKLGYLVFRSEDGDAYWDSPGELQIKLVPVGKFKILYEGSEFAIVSYTSKLIIQDRVVKANVYITFDDSEIAKFKIELNTKGTGFSILFRNEYKQDLQFVEVGMPFDTVQRSMEDNNLLPKDIPEAMEKLLIGQRDVEKTFTFPFHHFVFPKSSVSKKTITPVLVAKGIKAYQTQGHNTIDVVLRRSVDWIMKPEGHRYHTGDAGPKFYVPGAKCERKITLECGIFFSTQAPNELSFHTKVDSYVTPPLLFQVYNNESSNNKLELLEESVIISSLREYDGKILARIYNPTNKKIRFKSSYPATDPFGNLIGEIDKLEAKKISTIEINKNVKSKEQRSRNSNGKMLITLKYPIGADTGTTHNGALQLLIEEKERLYKKIQKLDYTATPQDNISHKNIHDYYIAAREHLEMEITYLWNLIYRSKLTKVKNQRKYKYKIEKELYDLAKKYNNLRIMRRMYDYIVDIKD